MSGALSQAYFMGISQYYHATVDGSSGRNRPYYSPSDWYDKIYQQGVVVYASESSVP